MPHNVSGPAPLEPDGAPGRRPSPLWSYAAEIQRLLDNGWTYPQIRAALAKRKVHVSLAWLHRWARIHLGRVRPARGSGRPVSDETPRPPPAPDRPAPVASANSGDLADTLLGPDVPAPSPLHDLFSKT